MQKQLFNIETGSDSNGRYNFSQDYNLNISGSEDQQQAGRKSNLQKELVNVNLILQTTYKMFRSLALNKGIEFRYDLTMDDNASEILTDGRVFETIISSLIKNALMVTESGYISFGYVKKGDNLEFYVSNTGRGLSDYETKILSSEFHINKDTKLPSRISGVATLIECKIFLKALGGSMTVSSDPWEGSVYYFTLPYLKNQKAD